MKIDLHTHSRVSDGTQSPRELVSAAREAELDVLGLTDHDTTAGWAEAVEAAEEFGVELVRGIEISTRPSSGPGVHLLAYLPDPTYPPLVEALDQVLAGRTQRLPRILAALESAGVPVTREAVERISAGTAATGRPHIADAMVEAGHVPDRDAAFATYLNPGRPGHVYRAAADLTEMIGIVARAGGVTVIAHPWGRHGRRALDAAALGDLRDRGLTGIEVDHQDHDAEARADLRAIARDLDLVVTGSSDHHGTGKVNHDLGVNTTAPEQYERLLERAAEAATASRRQTPGVVRHG